MQDVLIWSSTLWRMSLRAGSFKWTTGWSEQNGSSSGAILFFRRGLQTQTGRHSGDGEQWADRGTGGREGTTHGRRGRGGVTDTDRQAQRWRWAAVSRQREGGRERATHGEKMSDIRKRSKIWTHFNVVNTSQAWIYTEWIYTECRLFIQVASL